MAPTLRQESTNAHKTLKVSDERLAPTNNKQEVDDFVWSTWGDVFQIAQQIPHASPAQDSLAQVLVQLTKLPDTDRKVDWTGLPQIGWVLRDWFNHAPSEKHAEGADEILSAWVNVNAFWARLGALECLNTVDVTIWTLRRTLEEDHDEDATKCPKVFDCHVLTAAQYIEYSGAKVQKLIADGWKPQDNEAQMFKGGPLFDGPTGLSKERCQFWASRFKHVAGKTSSDGAKAAATGAADILED